ncbi:hypothetical protein I552_7720 [Mycobacterium xenopi 3993]|nr:hypothetical protein I552_7720 [Mycobacterium xenopi 3993]
MSRWLVGQFTTSGSPGVLSTAAEEWMASLLLHLLRARPVMKMVFDMLGGTIPQLEPLMKMSAISGPAGCMPLK